MTLLDAIESFITLKRSLGAVFSTDARILRSFGNSIGDATLDSISHDACQAFCRGSGPTTRFWERKHQSLRGFFSYLTTRGQLSKSPLPLASPRVARTFHAYIYSYDELRRLVEATTILDSVRSLHQPLTFRTLLTVLYCAGLRASEVLRLRRCDVNVVDRILTIWDTKFFKSRLVPIGANLCRVIDAYSVVRKGLPLPNDTRSAFFCTPNGYAISLAVLERVFIRLREHAEIRRPDSDRWQPRLHDLRHSFAVHRVIAWYREGANVQAHLPLLATYLGHINLSGTKAYLTMTTELLGEASLRFERYAGQGQEDGHAS